jgi:hypothetical protein
MVAFLVGYSTQTSLPMQFSFFLMKSHAVQLVCCAACRSRKQFSPVKQREYYFASKSNTQIKAS